MYSRKENIEAENIDWESHTSPSPFKPEEDKGFDYIGNKAKKGIDYVKKPFVDMGKDFSSGSRQGKIQELRKSIMDRTGSVRTSPNAATKSLPKAEVPKQQKPGFASDFGKNGPNISEAKAPSSKSNQSPFAKSIGNTPSASTQPSTGKTTKVVGDVAGTVSDISDTSKKVEGISGWDQMVNKAKDIYKKNPHAVQAGGAGLVGGYALSGGGDTNVNVSRGPF